MFVCMYALVCMCILCGYFVYANMCVCVCLYICLYDTHTHTHVPTYLPTYLPTVPTYIHTHIHTYTHIHARHILHICMRHIDVCVYTGRVASLLICMRPIY